MIYGVVLAGGVGSRMGNVGKPKQYLLVGDKPILIHTLEKFYMQSEFEKVLVLCPTEWITHTKNLVRKYMKDTEENQEKGYSVLVVGLGNREVTPDALGPYVVDQLNVTRHIVQEYGRYAVGKGGSRIVSAIVPGVMAQTGMESAEIIRGIVNETTPDLIMVIDALAARSTKRLNRTIQISDAGIYPGWKSPK